MDNNEKTSASIPPETKIEPVEEEFFGEKIVDPYRWLENAGDPNVEEWIERQHSYTEQTLSRFQQRNELKNIIAELLKKEREGVPVPRGDYYFRMMQRSDQDQPQLMVRKKTEDRERVLFDPNPLTEDSTTSIDWWYASRTGLYLAFGLSEKGSEKSDLHLMNVDTGHIYEDETIPGARHSVVSWDPDDSGFYYTKHPKPGTVPEQDEYYYQKVYYHKLGTDPEDDELIFGEGIAKNDIPIVIQSNTGEYLLGLIFIPSENRSEVFVKKTDSDESFKPVITGEDAVFQGEIFNKDLYLLTNLDAPNYRIIRIDLTRNDFSPEFWTEILPENEKTIIKGFSIIGSKLFVTFLENACSVLKAYTLDGKFLRKISPGEFGSIHSLNGRTDGDEAFFGFQSFHIPPTAYRIDMNDWSLTLLFRRDPKFDPESFEVKQVWYPSKDGTPISMFLGHRKDIELDGENPAILTGYGGFNISLTPAYNEVNLFWMNIGGVFAVPNLRGGSEYGESWHKAGMLGNKQNVFDDYIAAAEWLIENQYTRPEKLAARGGSNGGLLVGAAMTQRPELFRVVICSVPVLDMLRYHKYSVARYWIGEYGDPENPEHFKWLIKYSPYHNVTPNAHYPATFIDTADSDMRVDTMHAKKMTAKLQQANVSKYPIIFKLQRRAGHGLTAPISKRIEDYADSFAFIFHELGISLP